MNPLADPKISRTIPLQSLPRISKYKISPLIIRVHSTRPLPVPSVGLAQALCVILNVAPPRHRHYMAIVRAGQIFHKSANYLPTTVSTYLKKECHPHHSRFRSMMEGSLRCPPAPPLASRLPHQRTVTSQSYSILTHLLPLPLPLPRSKLPRPPSRSLNEIRQLRQFVDRRRVNLILPALISTRYETYHDNLYSPFAAPRFPPDIHHFFSAPSSTCTSTINLETINLKNNQR